MSKVWRKTSSQRVGSGCFSDFDDLQFKAEYMDSDQILTAFLNV